MRGMTIRFILLMIVGLFLYKNRFEFLRFMIGNMVIRQLFILFNNTFFRRRALFFILRSLKKISQ